jgi:hypothetical protein
VLPVFVEVGLCAIGEKDPPGFLEVAARLVEAGRSAGRAVPWMAARIEATAPLPLISAERIARAEPDRTNVYVAIEDQPALLSGIRIAAAGEGGNALLKRGTTRSSIVTSGVGLEPNTAGHHHQPMAWPVQAAVVSAVIRAASASRAFWKLSMGSGRFVTVRSPHMARVGRQDSGSPIRPQRTAS